MQQLNNPVYILGIELRTSNDNGQAFKDIPPFWDKFLKANYAEKIRDKLTDDIYAVYTDFEHHGKNNHGMYSLILGYAVDKNSVVDDGYKLIKIPAGHYLEFPVETGRPDKVGEVWQDIWAIPKDQKQNWLFTCEFERYKSNGEIGIYVGVKF